MEELFKGLFDSNTTVNISVEAFVICVLTALIIGLIQGFVYMYKNRYTQSFVMTLALLPAIVCVVIMMVNGNIGAGVAVTGAFSLVRFRSTPGSAKEIGAIFMAMGAGLICGMGYVGFAFLYTFILSLATLFYQHFQFGSNLTNKQRTLRITIPEDLSYEKAFTDILDAYTNAYQLVSIKTTNLGSLFKLTYQIELKDLTKEKEMMDALRCRNGNLEIFLTVAEVKGYEL